jgi:hypothetical protein
LRCLGWVEDWLSTLNGANRLSSNPPAELLVLSSVFFLQVCDVAEVAIIIQKPIQPNLAIYNMKGKNLISIIIFWLPT